MQLDLLPARTAGAAENMATDFLLLRRYPQPGHARFRHYAWRHPAVTFGFGQKIAAVRAQCPLPPEVELCRRPTGGGIVDHRDDWTYALVIPAGHPLHAARALASYQAVHAALAAALQAEGCPAALKGPEACPADSTAPAASPAASVCFQAAECYDVIHPETGAKIAGGAQKRTRQGLLFQGSLWKPAAAPLAWDQLAERFALELATALALAPHATGWPEWAEGELEALTEQYASPEWREYR